MAERTNIPELRKDERIERWKPLFEAATAGLRTTLKKAPQMLHICRTTAERELVIEVVSEHLETGDVDGALQVLIHNSRSSCRTDWARDEEVDVFFYRLKNAGSEAKAPMKMVYSVLVDQLPEQVQPLIKEWLGKEENAEITIQKGREFVRKVKSLLLEKGFRCDHGFRDLGRIAVIDKGKHREGGDELGDRSGDESWDMVSSKSSPGIQESDLEVSEELRRIEPTPGEKDQVV